MGRDQDTEATGGALAQQVLEHPRPLGVEATQRLIEHHERRVVNERGRDRGLLPHALRVGLDQIIGYRRELEAFEESLDSPRRYLGLDVIERCDEIQELAGAQALVEEGAVGDEAEP